MNLEELIKDEVNRFYPYGEWNGFHDAAKRLMDALELELYNHDEPTAKLIFLYEVLRLIRKDYDKHLLGCRYKDDPLKCDQNKDFIKRIYYVEQLIKRLNPEFNFTILRPQVNADLIHENLKVLSLYPNSGKLYQSALDKLNEQSNERNLLDDLRLSLESLLKEILLNDKSLENQTKFLGAYLKERNVSAECRNMFMTLLNYYCNYQNTYVKHNDKIIDSEVDLIVNLTSSLINFVINKST